MASLKRTDTALKKYAAGFPEAWEDHPWGETVFKVGKKVFVFFGVEEPGRIGLTVKLPDSGEFALIFPFTEVPGYGLGRGGWVSAIFGPDDDVPLDILEDWIEESYRTVAPRKLVKQLDGA